MLRHRLPSTGSLGSVPPLQRYYAVLRLPAAHSVSLRCLRSTVPKSAPVSLPRRAEPARRGMGLVTRCPSGFTSEASGPPRFLDVPVAHMLRSRTPVESPRPGLLGRAMQPSAVVTASASTSTNSRGSLTQPARSLCTLRSAGYPYTTQHSVPAGGQPLPGGIQDPPGRTEGFGAPWSAPSPLSRLGPAQHNFRLYLLVAGDDLGSTSDVRCIIAVFGHGDSVPESIDRIRRVLADGTPDRLRPHIAVQAALSSEPSADTPGTLYVNWLFEPGTADELS